LAISVSKKYYYTFGNIHTVHWRERQTANWTNKEREWSWTAKNRNNMLKITQYVKTVHKYRMMLTVTSQWLAVIFSV